MSDIEPFIPGPTHVRLEYAWSKESAIDVLIVRVSGTLPDGSLGNSDSDWICAHVYGLLRAFTPAALLFDFRALTYYWGNRMIEVLSIDHELHWRPIPCYYVVGPSCRPALTSLGLHPDLMFDEFDAALAALCAEAQELSRLDDQHSLTLHLLLVVREGTPQALVHRALASAENRLREHYSRAWGLRSWVVDGNGRVQVVRADDEAFARAQTVEQHVAFGPAGEVLMFVPRPDWPEWLLALPAPE